MRKQPINSPEEWAEDNREIRSRANKATRISSARQPAAKAASLWCSLPNGIVLPPEMGMEQDCCPTSPISQCALPASSLSQAWGSGCCWIPSSYPSLPSTLQGPLSKRNLPAQFGVTRVRKKRLPSDSWDKGREAAIQTTSLPSRARMMPEDSNHYVGILGHHKTPHISPTKN